MEHVEIAEFFARTDELDRLAGHGSCGKRRTAAGVAVELGKNQTVNAKCVVERRCHIHSILTGHGVDHQQNLVRMNGALDILELVHQCFIDMQTTCRIKKHIIVAVILGFRDCQTCNFNRVDLTAFKNGNACLFTHDLQLFDCGGTVNVARHKQRTVTLVFKHQCKLSAVGGFTGALQTAHHHDCRRMIGGVEPGFCAAHEIRQLFVDNLDNHLGRRQTLHHLCADGTFRDGFGKVFGNLVVDVCFQQRQPHFPHGVLDVSFGQGAFASQSFKGGLQSFGKAFKCHTSFILYSGNDLRFTEHF